MRLSLNAYSRRNGPKGESTRMPNPHPYPLPGFSLAPAGSPDIEKANLNQVKKNKAAHLEQSQETIHAHLDQQFE